jgi:hypothetical protein
MNKIFAIIAFLSISSQAQAILLLEVERISDTEGIISGSGTFTTALASSNAHVLSLESIFATTPGSLTNDYIGSGATLGYGGGNNFESVYTVSDSSTQTDSIYLFSATPTFGDVLSGFVTVTLTSGYTFDDIGASGTVYNGIINSTKVAAGSWIITGEATVPEPSIIVLLATGIFGIGLFRHKQS